MPHILLVDRFSLKTIMPRTICIISLTWPKTVRVIEDVMASNTISTNMRTEPRSPPKRVNSKTKLCREYDPACATINEDCIREFPSIRIAIGRTDRNEMGDILYKVAMTWWPDMCNFMKYCMITHRSPAENEAAKHRATPYSEICFVANTATLNPIIIARMLRKVRSLGGSNSK